MIFEICMIDKATEKEVIILNNNINMDTFRCRYNPRTKYLNDKEKNMLKTFQRIFNSKDRLIYYDVNTEFLIKADIMEHLIEYGANHLCSFDSKYYAFFIGGENAFKENKSDVMVI